MEYKFDKESQINEKSKKLISLVLVGSLLVGGCVVARFHKNGSKKTTNNPETTVTQSINTEDDTIILEEIDINDANAVRQRAQYILEQSNSNVSVEDIINMIYIFNDRADLATFASVQDMQKFIDQITELLKVNELKLESNEPSQMVLNNWFVGKKDYALQLDRNITKMQKLIKNNAPDDEKKAAAEEFYQLAKSLLEDKSELSDGNYLEVTNWINCAKELYAKYLSNEKYNELNDGYLNANIRNNATLSSIASDKGFSLADIIKANEENPTNCASRTPNGKSTGDAKDANAREATTKVISPDEAIVIKGGQPVANQTQVVQEPTTKTSVEESKDDTSDVKTSEVVGGGEVLSTEIYEEEVYIDSESTSLTR